MDSLTYFERLKSIYRCYINSNPKKGEIVKFLVTTFQIPNSTASKWQKDCDIPDPEVRYNLSKHFNLHNDIWTTNDWTDSINFELHVKDYQLIVNNDDAQVVLDKVVYGKLYSLDEHPMAMYHNILQLKEESKIHLALEQVEQLIQLHSRYIHKRYNEILLLKAILLSHDSIKKFDEAINILQLLYTAMKYHLKNPEVLTLLGSNYKRKSFFDTHGQLKSIIDKSYLYLSLQSYEQAIKIRTSERYYDAINIAYLKKILSDITKEDVNKLRLLEPNWIPKLNNWWEKVTSAEFYILAGDYENATREINEFLEHSTPSDHDVNATLRQITLYLHVKPDDFKMKSFYNYLNDSLKYHKSNKLNENNLYEFDAKIK